MRNVTMDLLKRISTIILTVIMCLGNVVPAYATNNTNEVSKTAAITKELKMPEGTITPQATFTFVFESTKVDGIKVASYSNAAAPIGPAIEPIKIDFNNQDTGSVETQTKTVIKHSNNILDNVNFSHAGIYEYEVKEEKFQTPVNSGYFTESFTFSEQKYTIIFYVRNGENGQPYVDNIIASKSDETGEVNEAGKVNPTSGMIFTNQYSKIKNGSDPTKPEQQALTISKVVAGEYANPAKYFEFEVIVKQPPVVCEVPEKEVYKAYVVSGESIVTSADNFGSGEVLYGVQGNQYVEFTPGLPKKVNLKHNQNLVFVDLHIGSSYTAEETLAKPYTTNILQYINGVNTSVSGLKTVEDTLIIEMQNGAEFTNTYGYTPPAGVVINNLPFILILLLAVGSLMGFIVVKSRKKNRYISR